MLGFPGYNQSTHSKISLSLVIEHDESESFLPATIDQLTNELRENFVKVLFDEKNFKWEHSDNEDDIDSECNIFDDIIIDAE